MLFMTKDGNPLKMPGNLFLDPVPANVERQGQQREAVREFARTGSTKALGGWRYNFTACPA